MGTVIALNRAFKDRDHEKVTHPTGGLIFAMVVNFLMSTVVNILVDIHNQVIGEGAQRSIYVCYNGSNGIFRLQGGQT
jgi:hypothetical protein